MCVLHLIFKTSLSLSLSLITKMRSLTLCQRLTPLFAWRRQRRFISRVNTGCLKVVCHASKTEEHSLMTHCSTVVGSCFIYKIWWFAPACLPGPVIHEWTRQREPAIVEVQREHWILRINFFHVTLLFPARSNPSLSCSVSAMTSPFLSLIVWSTIICPPADKRLEYYDGANL